VKQSRAQIIKKTLQELQIVKPLPLRALMTEQLQLQTRSQFQTVRHIYSWYTQSKPAKKYSEKSMQRFSSKFCTVASCAVILSALSACSTGAKDGLITSGSDSLSGRAAALDARERALAAKEANLSIVPASSRISSLTPPNAKPGQCFTKIFTPAKYRTVTEKQVAEEAGQRIEVIPASYKKGSKRVLVSEATEKLQVVPATYKTVTERVLVKGASSRLVQVPATYETVTSRIMETPARKEWKKGTGPIQRIDHDTGDIRVLLLLELSRSLLSTRL